MERLKRFLVFSKICSFKDRLNNYLRVVFIWCPIVTVLFIFGFGSIDNLARRFSISMIISTTVATSCFFGSWLTADLYNSYRRWRGQETKKVSFLWGVFLAYPFLLPGLYFGFIFAGAFGTAIGHTWDPPSFQDYSSGVIFGIMVSGLFSLFEVVRESKQAKKAAELKFRTLENENLKAQISALTAQMNPHLLFNSLNTIASTITTDPKSAEEMVVQLSELYRGILKSAKDEVHSLENELWLCRSYLDIEQKRFGPRVDYKILVAETIDPKKMKIPVLLIQPLVENAVKHGIYPKRDGGVVSIDVRKTDSHFVISVVDNGIGIQFEKSTKGTGSGLSNCESRVKLKYGTESKFIFSRNDKNETTACIYIPLKRVVCD